ncbi:MAG: hypothetical protein AAGA03_05710 [Planctomycetota bacterium]
MRTIQALQDFLADRIYEDDVLRGLAADAHHAVLDQLRERLRGRDD